MRLKSMGRALRDGCGLARRAERRFGVSLWRQAREILALRGNNLGIQDYYFYRLCDPRLHADMAVKRTYAGWRAFDAEFRRFSERRLQAMAYEKHVFYRLCSAFGVPVPEVRAVYAPHADCFERHRALTDRAALARWLSETDELPVFGKPSSANAGFGGRGIMSRDREGRFHMLDGSVLTPDELVDDLEEIAAAVSSTYLFTEFLENDTELARLAGATTASFRVVVLVRDGEPELFRAVLLVPGDAEHVSNYRGGATGTVLGGIDVATGVIDRVQWKSGLDAEELVDHPVSGVRLKGHVLACWPDLSRMVLEAARAMSPFRMQHWDVAMTTRGPVVMEMNFIGDVAGCQLFGPPGLYSQQYTSFAADHMWPSELC
ncbi:MAG: hypothetical protein GY838_00880 [bacterium]|nr:hypothetical protein [bacterium]